ncbi:MAG: DUF4397 domain-containing protein [Chitinophagales bacterium]|nr:DUF4397 domain-containing protein [Chitinophagales bacterium]
MKQKIFTMLPFLLASISSVFAQTARLQVIHNAADPAAASVDVYVNGGLLLDDFGFRTATPYTDVAAGVALSVAVAPSTSTSVGDAIATFPVGPLMVGETYVLFANGLVGSGFAANPDGVSIGFSLYPTAGRETSSVSGNVDVLVFHGSTDAPTVDVDARTGGGAPIALINDLAYTDFTAGYANIPAAAYALDVKDETGTATIATFIADLSGAADAAIVVFASGFLTPANNNNGAAFGLFAALPDGTVLTLPTPGTARVQVIHNSPDPLTATVDLYVNGLQGSTALNDLSFREATEFFDVQTGYPTVVSLNAPNSANADNGTLGKIDFGTALMDGGKYVIIADGLADTTGKSGINPDGVNPSFTLIALGPAQETGTNPSNADILIHHGSIDAPTVDIVARGVATLADDLSYLESSAGYASVPATEYIIDVKDASGTTTVKSYYAPLGTASGAAAIAFASGFLNPANGAPFGIWVALPTGTTFPLPEIETARVQVIHNSADAAAATVDVYVIDAIGDEIAKVEDVAFRTATAFVDLPSNLPLSIAFAPANSTSASQAVATINIGSLVTDEKYIAIANGIISGSGYNPAQPFELHIFTGAREEANQQGMSKTDVLVYHGSTDAPTVDIYETGVGAGEIVNDASYNDFAGYLELGTADYVIEVRDETGTTTVAAFAAPLATLGLEDAALTVLASGFLNPANNSNGAAFGLYAALPSGGALVALPLYTSVDEQNVFIRNVKFYPNPTTELVNVDFALEKTSEVRMNLFTTAGELVRSIQAGELAAGNHTLRANIIGLETGYYMVQIEAGEKLKVSQPVFVE